MERLSAILSGPVASLEVMVWAESFILSVRAPRGGKWFDISFPLHDQQGARLALPLYILNTLPLGTPITLILYEHPSRTSSIEALAKDTINVTSLRLHCDDEAGLNPIFEFLGAPRANTSGARCWPLPKLERLSFVGKLNTVEALTRMVAARYGAEGGSENGSITPLSHFGLLSHDLTEADKRVLEAVLGDTVIRKAF